MNTFLNGHHTGVLIALPNSLNILGKLTLRLLLPSPSVELGCLGKAVPSPTAGLCTPLCKLDAGDKVTHRLITHLEWPNV